jgi:flagellar M-ring protein FliF
VQKLFQSIFAQFNEFYKTLSPTKRVSLIGSILVGIVTLLFVFGMIGGQDYVPLFRNIPHEQISLIVEKLQEKNIPFQIRDDGGTIAIPSQLLHSTQMTLMAEVGSNKLGNMGLEIFDKQDLSSNSYSQKVNYQRALQGELMRAINTLSSVKQSKVILAMPAKKNFLEESTPASASVVLQLYPGKSLTPEQIRGIRYLVSSGVEGLDADRVTVVDDRGKILTRQGDQSSGVSGEMMELKGKIEEDMESRINMILAKVVGQAKVIAKVDVSLNTKTITSLEEIIDPDKTAIRSVTSEEEALDGSRTNPAGVPGSRSNLPNAPENAGQVGFNQNVKKELKTTNYEVPKTVKNIKEGTGNIERLSVAVLVDGNVITETKADGKTETKWVAREKDEILKYESLVKNAIGFNAARGDSVKIENIQFAQEDFNESDKILTNLERKRLLQAFLRWSLIGLALVLCFVVIIRPFMQWVTDSFQDSVEEMLPRTIEELEELHSVDNTLPGMTTALPVLEESVDPDKAESELLKDRINDILAKDGDKASNALSLWLVRRDDRV